MSFPRARGELSYKFDFDQEIESAIVLLLNEGCIDFESIVEELPSVYPAEVVKALLRLETGAEASPTLVKRILEEALVPNGKPIPRRVPIPHPADFDWPFSLRAEAVLVDVVQTSAPKGSLVALLGAPRLAARLSANNNYRLLVVDSNELALDAVPTSGIIRARMDITEDDPPQVKAGVVVLDPPWYEDYFQSFLWFASKICGPGAQVIMSLPPIGTRPGIDKERQRILSWARRAGLKRTHQSKAALAYETPHFERNALASEGVRRVPLHWRKGDLVILEATVDLSERNLKRPAPPVDKISWTEIEIEGIRVKLRSQESQWVADARLKPIIAGDVLPSVSRRDHRRQQIDVWTSGNRVFLCRNTALLGSLMKSRAGCAAVEFREIQESRMPEGVEQSILSETAAQIEALIQAEQEDSRMISPSEGPAQA
jgi:hypothetical protein